MAKKMLIDATHPEETRVVVVDGQKVDDFDFESINKRQLAGNIYLAKVTRVEPSLQAAFVDYGGNRHGFLAFAEVHPDYYQIPVADREALLAEEAALARAEADSANDPNGGPKTKRRRGGKGRKSSAAASAEGGGETDADVFGETLDATPEETDAAPAVASGIKGFDVIEPDASDATTDASDVDAAPAETALETDDGVAPPTETEVAADAAADIGTADASEDDGSEDAQVEDSTEVAAASEVDESQGEASGDGAAAEASEEDAGLPDTPPSEPRSMAESAGLGDEDDVVRGDVPPQGRKPDEDEVPADGEPPADAAPEVPADIEEPVVVMDEEAGRPSAE
ncbi:MAG: ribonuclease E/G, partial [Pseudomonadota bacterium]